MKHRSEIGQFCFCYKMFDRITWNFVQLFWRFWFCGHKWMLCILHVMFVAGHATCQQIPAQFVTFFSILHIGGLPIKIWHVEMINYEKVRLPRQICNFCVSAVSRMESSFFVSRKCLFLHLPLQAAGLLGLRFRAPNGITGRAPTTPGDVPTGVGRTATWYMWHV
jgi:hypothetical protein